MAKKPTPEIIASDIAEGILEGVGVDTPITDGIPLDVLQKRGGMGRVTVAVIGGLLLGGCALPVSFQIASLALDGLSFLVTQKSIADHGISMVARQDCALWRGVVEGTVCREGGPVTIIDEQGDVVEDGDDIATGSVLSSHQVALTPDTTQQVAGIPSE